MIDKIKAQLKVQYPKVNLSTTRIDAIAARLHKKFPELKEEEISDKLNDLNDLTPFDEIAKEDDRVRTLEAKLNKPADPKLADPKPADPAQADDTPAWAKALMEEVKTLKAEKQQVNTRQRLKEAIPDIPEDFYNEWALPNDDTFDAFTEKVKTKYTAIIGKKASDEKSETEQGLLGGTSAGGSKTKQTGSQVSPAMKEYLNAKKEQQKQTQTT